MPVALSTRRWLAVPPMPITWTAFGPGIVAAAAGIGSPVLLRASGPEGAGRSFCDPVRLMIGSLPDFGAGQEAPMTAGVLAEDEGCTLTDASLPRSADRRLPPALQDEDLPAPSRKLPCDGRSAGTGPDNDGVERFRHAGTRTRASHSRIASFTLGSAKVCGNNS